MIILIGLNEKTCLFTHNIYEELHPQRNSNLLFLAAGIDNKENPIYLYEFFSQNYV